jgi:hypothetical protein
LERNPNNKPANEATITITTKKRNPNVFAARAARNPTAISKKMTTPYKIDLTNGISGNRSTLITGTKQIVNKMIKMTKRHLLSHHAGNTPSPS